MVRRKWSGHDVPERGQPRMLRAGEEVEHHLAVGVVADLRPVGRGEAPDERQQRRGTGVALGLGQRLVPGRTVPKGSGRPWSAMYRSAVRMISSECASHSSEDAPTP